MSTPRIHASHCRCQRCAPLSLGNGRLAPSLRASILAATIAAGIGALLWLATVVAHQLAALFS